MSLTRSAAPSCGRALMMIWQTRFHEIDACRLARVDPMRIELPRCLQKKKGNIVPHREKKSKTDGYIMGNPFILSRCPHGPSTPQSYNLGPLTRGPIICQPNCRCRRVHVSTCPCVTLPHMHVVPRQLRGSQRKLNKHFFCDF